MEIIKLKSPEITVINGKEVKYNKKEIHIHKVEPKTRLRLADIDPADVVRNIIHNSQLMGNARMETSMHSVQVTITDVVDSTLIINKWIIRTDLILEATANTEIV